jgi:hypothetical protein
VAKNRCGDAILNLDNGEQSPSTFSPTARSLKIETNPSLSRAGGNPVQDAIPSGSRLREDDNQLS